MLGITPIIPSSRSHWFMEGNPKKGLGCQRHLSHLLVAQKGRRSHSHRQPGWPKSLLRNQVEVRPWPSRRAPRALGQVLGDPDQLEEPSSLAARNTSLKFGFQE